MRLALHNTTKHIKPFSKEKPYMSNYLPADLPPSFLSPSPLCCLLLPKQYRANLLASGKHHTEVLHMPHENLHSHSTKFTSLLFTPDSVYANKKANQKTTNCI